VIGSFGMEPDEVGWLTVLEAIMITNEFLYRNTKAILAQFEAAIENLEGTASSAARLARLADIATALGIEISETATLRRIA
jgi:hypothetical protein